MALRKEFEGMSGNKYVLTVKRSRHTGYSPGAVGTSTYYWSVVFGRTSIGSLCYLHSDRRWHSSVAHYNSLTHSGYFISQEAAMTALQEAIEPPPGFDDIVAKLMDKLGLDENQEISEQEINQKLDGIWGNFCKDSSVAENDRLGSVMFGPWGRIYRI